MDVDALGSVGGIGARPVLRTALQNACRARRKARHRCCPRATTTYDGTPAPLACGPWPSSRCPKPHSVCALNTCVGVLRGFLPRGLCDTGPQVVRDHRLGASSGQVSHNPKQKRAAVPALRKLAPGRKPPMIFIATAPCNRSTHIFHTTVGLQRFLGACHGIKAIAPGSTPTHQGSCCQPQTKTRLLPAASSTPSSPPRHRIQTNQSLPH